MELQIFSNSEFGEIRTITKDNEPMFCLADVCKALEISNVGNVKQRLSEKGIHTADTLTKGGMQKMTFISEANLYKTIFQSRKESAEHVLLLQVRSVYGSKDKRRNVQLGYSIQ